MPERRKYPRVNVEFMLEDVMEMSSLTMKESGKVTNLSAGGCGVVSEGQYAEGSLLSFNFTLPNGKPLVQLKGLVVRVSKAETGWNHGVKFQDLGYKNWMRLKWYLMFHHGS